MNNGTDGLCVSSFYEFKGFRRAKLDSQSVDLEVCKCLEMY